MGSQYKKSWHKFAEVTTIHGVRDMVFANARVSRVLWVAVMLASVSLLGYQAFKIMKKYHEGATSFQSSIVTLDTFPPIRIISRKVFDISKAKELGLKDEHVCFLMGYFKDWPYKEDVGVYFGGKNLKDIDTLEKEVAEVIRKNNITNVVQLAKVITIEPIEAVRAKSLSVDTAPPTVSVQADSFGISYVFETYRQNYNDTVIPWDSGGAMWGLYMDPYRFHSSDPICWDEDLSSNTFVIAVGDGIFEQNQWLETVDGNIFDIIITPYRKHLINKSDRPCRDGNITKAKCVRDCQVQLYSVYNFTSNRYTHTCLSNGTVFFTGDSTYSGKFYNGLHGMKGFSGCNQMVMEKINDCISSCNEPCEQEGFTVQIKSRNTQGESQRREEIGVNIWVKMILGWSVESVKEEYVYSVETFMSNFGGLLGLFTGASLISILQLMVYTFCGTWVTKRDGGVATEASAEKKDGELK